MIKQPGAQSRRVSGQMGQSYEQQADEAEKLRKTALTDATQMVTDMQGLQPATRGGVTIRKPPPGATTAETIAGVQEAQAGAAKQQLGGRDFGALARQEILRRRGMDPNMLRGQAVGAYDKMKGSGTMGRQILEDTARAAGSELAKSGSSAVKSMFGAVTGG